MRCEFPMVVLCALSSGVALAGPVVGRTGIGAGHADACGCGTCGRSGGESPIDIRSENLTLSTLDALSFDYSGSTTVTARNTGSPEVESTIRTDVQAGAGSVRVGNGPVFNLVQFHFHQVSEHLLNGNSFDMELHMVHQDASGNLMVVARWIEIGSFNESLDAIFGELPEDEESEAVTVDAFDLGSLLSDDLRSVRYTGSLTTSPFSGPVSWVVLTDTLEISLDQFEAFADLYPEGNSREPQALLGRSLFTDDARLIPAPASAAVLLMGVLASRRRRA